MRTGIQVADALADASAHGPAVAKRVAQTFTQAELVEGLKFITVVQEVASASLTAIAQALK